MNRVNPKKQTKQKKPTKVAKAKVVKKATSSPKRTFKTTRAQKSTLYAHYEKLGEASPTDATNLHVPNPIPQNVTQVEGMNFQVPFTASSPGLADGINRHTTFTIYKACKNAMQNEKNDDWSWSLREDRGRGDYTNQLAGDDYFGNDNQFYPEFPTKEAAILFCQEQGHTYKVEAEPLRRYDLRSYADNFKWKGLPQKDDV